MNAFVYTAMTGAQRIWQSLQHHANNLANLTTVGFQPDREWVHTERVPGYGYDTGYRPVLEATGIAASEGPLIETARPLDVAIQGQSSYFTVLFNGQEAYTRAGALSVDAEGILHIQGWPVLGNQGPIRLPPLTDIHNIQISQDGTISIVSQAQTEQVDRLKLVYIEPILATKNEAGLIVTRSGLPVQANEAVTLRSGYLEGSAVSAMSEMLQIMHQGRDFEMQMRFFKAADEIAAAGDRLIRGG